MEILLFHEHRFYKEMVKALYQRRTVYKPTYAMEAIQKLHTVLSEHAQHIFYVLPGALRPGDHMTESCRNRLLYLRLYRDRCVESAQDPSFLPSRSERDTAMQYARFLGPYAVPATLISYLGQWMQRSGLLGSNMTVLQAPYEATWQLVQLEQLGVTDATVSNDSLVAVLGSRHQFVNLTLGRKEKPRAQVYRPEIDLFGKEHYKYNLLPFRNHLPELATLTGCTPYVQRLSSHLTSKDYLTKVIPKYLRAREDPQQLYWFWQQLAGNPTDDYIQAVERTVHLLRHCPVLRERNDSDVSHANMASTAMELAPLHPLPSPTVGASDDDDNDAPKSDWKDWIGFDPAEHLGIPPEHYSDAAWCVGGRDKFFGESSTEWTDWCNLVQPYGLPNRQENHRASPQSRALEMSVE